jgi:t-SNARE complex subunit (syntaxin)
MADKLIIDGKITLYKYDEEIYRKKRLQEVYMDMEDLYNLYCDINLHVISKGNNIKHMKQMIEESNIKVKKANIELKKADKYLKSSYIIGGIAIVTLGTPIYCIFGAKVAVCTISGLLAQTFRSNFL